ncbi:GNAT family N-acetyltransferase [Rhizobiales bacterium RZME27]|uniref:GNAT family N-acetyltransferase n=1 Tax=Endobacterium cereale TaxID=2663029 RepID=A0A6A8A3C5_9HYPH|nr:GNAT family N-acetyltransferase [Endobacterium cereale]MEB2846509.1 GNAT family N-acetyltransferase [Endobacterium cereale]MQY45383.1 GNAT family N-acetyltransferase [Endobacterium cereale]
MSDLIFRQATEADLKAIIGLLADDVLGAEREAQTDAAYVEYEAAFREITADPNQFLCAVEDQGEIVGTFQLTFIPGLSRGGAKRAQIEAVRVLSSRRNEHIGEAVFVWASQFSRDRGCSLMQLTTDKQRPDAHRFYDRLGFSATHIGYKLDLSATTKLSGG